MLEPCLAAVWALFDAGACVAYTYDTFLWLFHVRIPTYMFFCLRFGSNSLFAGFSCSYTHVYVLVLASWVQLPFLHLLCVCIPTYTSVCLFFLGVTPFLQVFCVCTPTCTSFCLLFGSNSLLADIVASHAHERASSLL